MEKNIRTKIVDHNQAFKLNLQEWIQNSGATISICGCDRTHDFIQYLNDFPDLELEKDDFQKRKRVKNNVPDYNRCIALKCNGERCSRKQKDEDSCFCGTHMKGANYETIEQSQPLQKKEKIQLWVQEINGISRYVDKNSNVYCMQDIMNSRENPRVVAKYGVYPNGMYYLISS
jgi:hypothetical protein